MSSAELAAKQAHFDEQKLLDLSDDETCCNNEVFDRLESAMAEGQPAKLTRQTSSFLGPTPKEVKADFEAHTSRRRALVRDVTDSSARAETVQEVELTQSFPVTKPRTRQRSHIENETTKVKRITSLPNMSELDQIPFYRRMGVTPRELKTGKNVKPAENIQLDPEFRQVLRGKIVYFYPNDDISMSRRMRIHTVIRQGAAWVNKWRDDVTHVFVDDASHTYTQLLRHLNRAGFPVRFLVCNR